MAVFCYSIGTISGTIVGTIGTILYCILINGLRGMPGWALGNIVIGLIMGITFKVTKKIKNTLLSMTISILSIIISTVLGIGIVKSGVECILYAQPFLARVVSNSTAFVADLFMLIISLPICKLLNPHITKLTKSNM